MIKNFLGKKIFSIEDDEFRKTIKVLGIKIKLRKGPKRLTLNYLETHIVDHCNLNCKGCSHFCPLTPENFVDVDEFEKMINEVSKKFKIKVIRLLGGEPLLHPQVCKFMEITRRAFPKTDIRIVTNGILLSKMPQEFWQSVNENGIIIDLSKYPMGGENFAKGLDAMGLNKAKLGCIHLAGEFFLFLNSKGDSDRKETFDKCKDDLRYCVTLYRGKIFICTTGAYMHRYNEYFGTNIPEEKGIDIYTNSAKDILQYLETPIDTCKYCFNNPDWKYIEWGISKKEKDEWFADKN